MPGAVVTILAVVLGLAGLTFWNKYRVKGKMLCYFARKDKSVTGQLCELRSSFVIWKDRAYDVYPGFVRVARFPMGWPSILQELVPAALYDEEDALPKDWVTLETPKEGSLSLRSALEENWVKKLVQEAAAEGGIGINWRRMWPLAAIAVGAVGLILMMVLR